MMWRIAGVLLLAAVELPLIIWGVNSFGDEGANYRVVWQIVWVSVLGLPLGVYAWKVFTNPHKH